MNETAAKDVLHRYLREASGAVLWKVDGISEYDARRPLTPTGTNLLGLVKHLSIVEAYYLGTSFERPFAEHLPWWDDDQDPQSDAWATEDETREQIVDLYRRVNAHADATIEALDLDAPGLVPWWGDSRHVTLHQMLVHVIAESNRHTGHVDILREQVDGATGMSADSSNLPDYDATRWAAYRERLEQVAQAADPAGAGPQSPIS
ncbi:DinB family protein [Luteipulveratus sp. YIM 133132]|uniref:DinB family protein n=1 Tax=Luteipulveratus flavus TaxID=3031728 RepID=UPI0023B0FBB5|nr:DinB family protein [Luteipulveratus sp. YIM 133132]MDE9365172.1 DinB family protein [Luteipulveratus sp. YIM 133132]